MLTPGAQQGLTQEVATPVRGPRIFGLLNTFCFAYSIT